MNALIMVAKRPTPGSTKTRLSPPFSLTEAANLYEKFLYDMLDIVRQVPEVQPVLAYLPAEAEEYFRHLAPDFECILQRGDDLGARLDNTLSHYFNLGYERVAIMNSDSPNLPLAHLIEAFNALSGSADLVLGPCDDGGYYLIGMKHPLPRLLREVQMSTPTVAADTLALAYEESLSVHLLPAWYDVDDARSLTRLVRELAASPDTQARNTRAFVVRSGIDGKLLESREEEN